MQWYFIIHIEDFINRFKKSALLNLVCDCSMYISVFILTLSSVDISCSLFQDRGILSQSFSKQTEVGYILSLGVSKDHRRNGIASLLLDNLISHLTTVEHVDCKALFLHVLTTNSPAIHFYEHRNFR
jgi:ribosomal protein S18 acetylase RimI-like enzyme